ncbi:MAG: carboxylesterase family protein, partial [Umezawaea sp.]
MRKLVTFLSAVLVAAVCVVPANATSAASVRTDAGPVSGTVGDTYRTFQGIPYAAPPVGENRWRDPQPVTPWTTPRDATAPGPRCAQAGGLTGPGSTSEDCLYLNVTTPRHGAHLPVMVWIH